MISDVLAEMKRRALEGCGGDHGFTCSDPDYAGDVPLTEWCDECLMSAAVVEAEADKRCAACALWTVKFENAINRGCNHPNRPLMRMPTSADFCCSLFQSKDQR
jgi:hypothetical protein